MVAEGVSNLYRLYLKKNVFQSYEDNWEKKDYCQQRFYLSRTNLVL